MAWCELNDENVAKDPFLDENKNTSDGKQLSMDSLLPYLIQDKPVGRVGIITAQFPI